MYGMNSDTQYQVSMHDDMDLHRQIAVLRRKKLMISSDFTSTVRHIGQNLLLNRESFSHEYVMRSRLTGGYMVSLCQCICCRDCCLNMLVPPCLKMIMNSMGLLIPL